MMLRTMTLVFTGDFKPDHGAPELGFLRGKALVSNLECAVSDSNDGHADKAYPVIYAPADLQRLQAYPFSVVSIANNHIGDAGAKGLALLDAGLRQLPGVAVAGTAAEPVVIRDHAGLKVAIIASLEPCRARPASVVREDQVEGLIRSVRNRVDRVFVTPHWGKEGEYALFHSPAQRQLARRWIAAGADAVLGHHSHTVHGMEWIDGKPVFYSLGNFIFDHEESREHPLTKIGLVVEWQPGAATGDEDEWLLHPITAVDGRVAALPDELRSAWLALHDKLGRWPRAGTGSGAWLQWARAVGHTYITKSDKSWAKRLHGGSIKTRLLWLIWSCLPMTLLLRLGTWFPDREALALQRAFEEQIMQRIPRHVNG